ncbi:probable tyrosyl-DNA phosphodiesterase [Cloeon dipterum]|uniref:probable tyrosyl-DNA phosphodiesterase n=1 Tax=Cloeon dipterum TaxID=197152 RepID=UPI0032206C07
MAKDECSFGRKCYRLNPIHFREYSHAHLNDLIEQLGLNTGSDSFEIPSSFKTELSHDVIKQQVGVVLSVKKHKAMASDYAASVSGQSSAAGSSSSHSRAKEAKPADNKKSSVLSKWENAAPFHFFMTVVPNIPQTLEERLSISLADLYDESLGEIEESLQINFMIDVNFLMKNLAVSKCLDKPLLALYETSNVEDLKSRKNMIKAVCVKPKSMFGHHHTKMSIFLYKDKSIRVVVSTANLIEEDWNDYSQGVWISPSCPPAPDKSKGESCSGFRSALASYLGAYKLKDLEKWIQLVRGADFSEVKVCLVASVPSTGSSEVRQWGLGRVKSLLQKFVRAEAVEPNWPLVVQCSSIGSLGSMPSDWLESQLKVAMLGSAANAQSKTPLKMVYPCLKDVKDSLSGGGCLPYSFATHRNQTWLTEFVHKWRADGRKRSRAMPHIKTYCRLSPDWKKAAWFLLTSSNLSKAAWGRSTHQGKGQNILSYEAGVLFIPQLMIQKNHFDISHLASQEGEKLPFPFDLPPVKYESSDKLWVAEYMVQ